MGIINLNHPAHFLGFGSFNISLGNFIIVVVMFVLFFAAMLIPFPHSKNKSKDASNLGKGSDK
jgi:flagellar basal body-associated protein FliL